jgi:hypothetical protein
MDCGKAQIKDDIRAGVESGNVWIEAVMTVDDLASMQTKPISGRSSNSGF